MNIHYSAEKSTLILIALLKAHNIKNIVVSPGATNLRLVASLQNDDFFKLFSVVDERSAAYMACGLAAESDEPVMLSCTGATASRNYMPGLTEAFYRKLPILVVTSSQFSERIGQLKDQVTDRISVPADIVTKSVQIPCVENERQNWYANLKINEAILELKRHGGGPSHINLITNYSSDFSVEKLPITRVIRRYSGDDSLPIIPEGNVAIIVGSHANFTSYETHIIEDFCSHHNSVVFCDHTSGYYGKFKVNYSLCKIQPNHVKRNIKLLIHIGEISGDMFNISDSANEVWRVSEDGEIRDTFYKLTSVFEMKESAFFNKYISKCKLCIDNEYKSYQKEYTEVYNQIPDLPFSNIWIAKNTSCKIPPNSILHLGILSTLRSWNFFKLPSSVKSYCNVGGFGIDGNMSTLLGASFYNKNNLYIGIFGDLSFFYDMNSIGNRHIGSNIRILLINNGQGCEFTHHLNMGSMLGESVNPYVSAAGHFGNKSNVLVKHYAEDLGFVYLSADSKELYLNQLDFFLSQSSDKPILFEVFTETFNENLALKLISSIKTNVKSIVKSKVRNIVNHINY